MKPTRLRTCGEDAGSASIRRVAPRLFLLFWVVGLAGCGAADSGSMPATGPGERSPFSYDQDEVAPEPPRPSPKDRRR